MADTIKAVTNLDIQLLDANHSNAKTVKLDNPMDNITREQVSAAFITPLTEGWFLAGNGATAMYIGDIVINQSIKTTLGGEDFYVTPASINDTIASSTKVVSVTVSGATIQGYNFANVNQDLYYDGSSKNIATITATIAENALSIEIKFYFISGRAPTSGSLTLDLILIIQGESVTVPINLTAGS